MIKTWHLKVRWFVLRSQEFQNRITLTSKSCLKAQLFYSKGQEGPTSVPKMSWQSPCHSFVLLLISRFSRVWLCATLWTATHQAPPSLGFSRQEHWSRLPFPSPMHESEKWKWSCSVLSDSQRPHGLQPTRLLRPWDFPGKSTGVGCHCLLRLVLPPSLKGTANLTTLFTWLFSQWYAEADAC